MAAVLQDHLFSGGRAAKPLHDAFLSPSTFLTGAAVDEIMKTGGWKTESTAYYTVGATRVGKWVASLNAARAMQTIASYHCHRVRGK